ncbi:MAG: cyclase family protein [Thermomicrobiales bacterium]
MCSPDVMHRVALEVSRRKALIATGAAAFTAVGPLSRTISAQEATPLAENPAFPGFSTIVDLTHTWGPDFPVFFGATSPTFEVLATVEVDFFFKMLLQYDEHVGTHLDAPAHFAADGLTADLLPVTSFFAPLCIIDISSRAAEDADALGLVEDIESFEAEYGPIEPGSFVALNSGWDATVEEPGAYINLDADDVQHYLGWSAEAAAALVERGIVGAGVDTASLDYGMSTDFAAHLTFLPAGVFGVEGLANLGDVPVSGAHIIIGAPKHEGASGGPSRIFAVY